MRRLVTVARRTALPAAAVAVTLLGATGCSGSGGSDATTAVPSGRAGNPTDTASPTGPSPTPTSTPPPTGPATGVASASDSSSSTVAALDLPACMIGDWSAPLAREFGDLGLAERSGGTVRSATGVLAVRFTADRKWTFTYQQVTMQLTAGSADVSGPVTGTWSLAGNTLTSTVVTSSVQATMHLGGVAMGAPGTLTTLLRALPPDQVRVTCTGTGLQFQLPGEQGGGTATFDHA